MNLIAPFAGLRPAPGRAAEVIAPPYDVVNSDEARRLAVGRPYSFLHVSKPEIDLPPDVPPYSEQVYAKGAENLLRMIEQGVLVRDANDCYYIYRLEMNGHCQTGLVVAASVAAYDARRICRHEFTRPDKEDDRVRHIEALNAQTGPALLAYPDSASVDALLAELSSGEPVADATADSGVRHSLWVVSDRAAIDALSAAVESLPRLYIADGHHRSAAASRVAATRRSQGSDSRDQRFLAVMYPQHQMHILDYNRVIRDLNGLSAAALLEAVAVKFNIAPSTGAVGPTQAGEYGLYLDGAWHRLRLRDQWVPKTDPVARLDVSLLHDHLIAPLLGITDPRRDTRIDFVGGIRGLEELEKRVDSGEMALAFSLRPTPMADLMAVADSGQVMPPKSTWFEPKLADGLVTLQLAAG